MPNFGAADNDAAQQAYVEQELAKQKKRVAEKKNLANNFGVPQELLDFLKQKVTDKESEVTKLQA